MLSWLVLLGYSLCDMCSLENWHACALFQGVLAQHWAWTKYFPPRRWSLTCPSSMKGGPVGDAKNSCWMLQWNHLSEVWGRERTLDSIVEIMDLYKELGLSRPVLQKVVWMWRAAHFDVSVFLTTHAMIAKLYFCCKWIGLRENLQETIDFPIKYGAIHWCWRACGGLMFWRAPRWPEFLAGLGWGFSWGSRGTRAQPLFLCRNCLWCSADLCACLDRKFSKWFIHFLKVVVVVSNRRAHAALEFKHVEIRGTCTFYLSVRKKIVVSNSFGKIL